MPPPSNLRFVQAIRIMLSRQAREVLARLTLSGLYSDEQVDLSQWTEVMAESLKPYMLRLWQAGMYESAMRITRLRGGSPPPALLGGPHSSAGIRMGIGPSSLASSPTAQQLATATESRYSAFTPIHSHTAKVLSRAVRKAVGFQFDLFNPKVLDAVDQATFAFCRETNQTTTEELSEAITKLRAALKLGLSQGEALQVLAHRVVQIFANPYRAFRIAATETSMAMNGGALMAAKESGIATGKEWLASADGCSLCLSLDGKEVGLDEPFYVDRKGGPYAVKMTPPAHPFCQCTFTEVL